MAAIATDLEGTMAANPATSLSDELAAALDAVATPLTVISAEGRVVFTNRACKEVFGDSPPPVPQPTEKDTLTHRGATFRVTARPLAEPSLRIVTFSLRNEPLTDVAARLGSALEALPHKAWMIDSTGTVLYQNGAIRAFFGKPLPLDRATRDAGLFHPDDRPRLTATRARSTADGGAFKLDLRMRGAGGDWRWHHLAVAPVDEDAIGLPVWLVMATDIHDLHVTSDKLRAVEERLTLAQAIAQVGIWDWDTASGDTVINDVYYALLGLPSGSPHTYDDFLAMVHEDDRARVAEANRATVDDGAEYDIEYRIRRPDGAIRWLAARGRPLGRAAGRARRFLGVLVDVTEAKAAAAERERLIRQTAEQLQELEHLYQAAPIGLAMLDDQLRFQRINGRLAEINGYKVADHIGRRVWDLVPDLQATAEPLLRRLLETGEALHDVEISGETAAAPGIRRQWIEHFFPLAAADGAVRGIGIICEEVTAQRAAAANLALSERRLRLATDAGEIGVFEWHPASDTGIFVNARMRELLGVDDAVSRAAFLEHIVHPDDRPAVVAAIGSDRSPGRTLRVVCRIRRSDRRDWQWIEFAGEFLGGDGQQPDLRFLGTARDVTERIQSEQTQLLLIAELDHRVKNTLATVQSIAAQTLKRAASPAAFVEALQGRLQALSRAHTILTETTWTGADLERLVREQLALTDGAAPRVTLDGGPVDLPPTIALRLGLVIHELGTNARKYGALTDPEGRVHLSWRLASDHGRDRLQLVWQESGGPGVREPTHRGFGTRLIEASLAAMAGSARLTYPPTGLRCEFVLPLD